MKSQEQEGIGAHKMWGYTAAQDLLLDAPQRGEVNILVCQAGDVGHILRTIASRRRHQQHTINFYVWEGQIEVLARHLLLLAVAKDWELPIRQRVNTFLEIFGNAFLQERTSRYIARLGKELVEMLFSTEKDSTADVVDFSLLKWRHRDLLEMTLKSWDCSAPCDLKKLRDSRLRDFYGVRYDYRKNLVDWDYTNRLKEVASIIHLSQYRKWRLDGIAYEFGEQVYNEPNRTMMSYAEGIMMKGEHRGIKKEMRGFWLDIRVGPFITFGVDCDRPNAHAEDLFTIINKGTGTEQHRHNTAEVAVYSIISYLWGLEYRGQYVMTKATKDLWWALLFSVKLYPGFRKFEPYRGESVHVHVLPQKDDVYSGLGDIEELEACNSEGAEGGEEVMADVDEQESRSGDTLEDKDKADVDVENIGRKVIDEADTKRPEDVRKDQALARAQCILETFDGVKVFMLSGDISQNFSKPRFHQLFHRVHLSLTAVDLVGLASINECLADDAVITMDTGRYMVPLNQEQQLTFIERVCSMASDRGWKGLLNKPGLKDGPDGPMDKKGEDVLLSMDHIGFSFKRKDG